MSYDRPKSCAHGTVPSIVMHGAYYGPITPLGVVHLRVAPSFTALVQVSQANY